MERLTRRANNGNADVFLTGDADTCWAGLPVAERGFCIKCPDLKGRDRKKCGVCLMIDRLAAYEDIGTVEEFRTALRRTAEDDKAREEGRLVVLPCRVGDTVYICGKPCRESFGYNDCGKAFDEKGNVNIWCEDDCPEDGIVISHGFALSDLNFIGKTVFLTREEAAAALGGGEGG